MKNKVVVIMALMLAVMCLFAACSSPKEQNDPALATTTFPAKPDPNAKFTPNPGTEDTSVVVYHTSSEHSDETVTYYFVNNVYSRQESVIVYATEEAAKVGFNPVKTYSKAKLEGNTVSFEFVSNAFYAFNREQVVAYWEKQFSQSPEFHKASSVNIKTLESTGGTQTADGFDTLAVELVGSGESATEAVTYYFTNDVYTSQKSVIVYATEEAAKVGFTPVSTYEEAKLEGNTVSFKFVSAAFTGMNREQVVQYWEKQFESSDGFYANYSVSIVDKAE